MTIDYELGEINVWQASSYTTVSASASYQPAVAITGAVVSGAIPISNQNRDFNYTLNVAEAKQDWAPWRCAILPWASGWIWEPE